MFVLRTGWNRIFSLSLFVEHLLLGIEEVEKKLTPVVWEHTRRLSQVGLSFCTNLNFHNMNSKYYNKILSTIIPSPIIRYITSAFPSRYWKKILI